jgi:hypothetical protein
MRRLAAAALLLLVPFWASPGAASDATLGWDSDRVVDSTILVGENDTLEIAAGVDIRFEPGPAGPNETRPMLAVTGGLLVNGTAGRRVNLTANETLWWTEPGPDCLNVLNDGRRGSLAVRNATFTDIVINIYLSGGEFSDCVFDRCDLNVARSNLVFANCTFIYSALGSGGLGGSGQGPPGVVLRGCRFDGRDPASHPPLPYQGEAGPGGVFWKTAVELREPVVVEDCLVSGHLGGISAGLNGTSILNATVRDCPWGIWLNRASPDDSGEVRGCTVLNCSEVGVYSYGRLRLSDSIVGDCNEAGVFAYGGLLLGNCTIYNCTTGVSLRAPGADFQPDWLLSGNRISGCALFAVSAEDRGVDISGNRFEDGGTGNGLGRLLVSNRVVISVIDPSGRTLAGPSELSWTDARGGTGFRTVYPDDSILFGTYIVDNNGTRADLFPYELHVRRGAIENRTVLSAVQARFSVTMPVLPDLVPVFLQPDQDDIVAGREVRFLVRVDNLGTGPARESTVVFLVDGREMDRGVVPDMGIRGRASVYSDPWTARTGRHRVEVRLDDRALVPEADEANNNITTEFNVGAALAGESGPLTGTQAGLLATGAFGGILAVVFGARILLRSRRSGPGAAAEPAPAPLPGATRIKCPKCGKLGDVRTPGRPQDIKCGLCGFRMRFEK